MKPELKRYSAVVGTRTFTFETGTLAAQAGGAVTFGVEESIVFAAATMGGVREERAQRTIGQPGGENRVGAGASLAAEEGAGDFAASIEPFFVFDREREEVDAIADAAHGGSRKDDSFIGANGNRAAGLVGQLAGFKRNNARPDGCRVAF